MRRREIVRSCLALAVLLAAPALARTVAVPLHGGSALQLELPDGWQESHQEAGPIVSFRLTPAAGEGDFLVLLTAMPVQPGAVVATDEGVRAVVTEEGTRWLASAVQERLEVVELRGDHGTAFLYRLTDRNPEKQPGDFREVRQGAMLIGTHLLSITILTHTGDDAVADQAQRLLLGAEVLAGQNV
jgi:hypothetical protein